MSDPGEWIPVVSGVIGFAIAVAFVVICICNFCACCAIYKRRRQMEANGMTVVTQTGYGRGGRLGRNQVIIVHQGNPNEAQLPPDHLQHNAQQPPQYITPPAFSQEPPPMYTKDPLTNQGPNSPHATQPFPPENQGLPYPAQPSTFQGQPAGQDYPRQPFPPQGYGTPYPNQPAPYGLIALPPYEGQGFTHASQTTQYSQPLQSGPSAPSGSAF